MRNRIVNGVLVLCAILLLAALARKVRLDSQLPEYYGCCAGTARTVASAPEK